MSAATISALRGLLREEHHHQEERLVQHFDAKLGEVNAKLGEVTNELAAERNTKSRTDLEE
eukprot:8444768-Pyramimonas_sp.AAC.1